LKLMTESRSGSLKRRCASARRMKAICRVVLVEAGVEDAGDAEALVLGREAERGQLALRAGDQTLSPTCAPICLGEVFAETMMGG
jgi:hypothetical protein